MSYEIRVVEGERPTIEATLNKTADEGWQLVSCWPEASKVVAVFQRLAGVSSNLTPETAKAAPPPIAKGGNTPVTLETVLAACLEMLLTKNETGIAFRGGLSVAQFAKQQGVSKENMLATLQQLGLKAKKDDNDKKYRTFVTGRYSLWLKQAGKHAAWYVELGEPKPRK